MGAGSRKCPMPEQSAPEGMAMPSHTFKMPPKQNCNEKPKEPETMQRQRAGCQEGPGTPMPSDGRQLARGTHSLYEQPEPTLRTLSFIGLSYSGPLSTCPNPPAGTRPPGRSLRLSLGGVSTSALLGPSTPRPGVSVQQGWRLWCQGGGRPSRVINSKATQPRFPWGPPHPGLGGQVNLSPQQ